MRVRTLAAALLLGGTCLTSVPGAALADDTAEDLKELRATIKRSWRTLKKREQKLHQEFLRLDQKSRVLDEQLRKLRAAGTGPASAPAAPARTTSLRQGNAAAPPKAPPRKEVAQTAAPAAEPPAESAAPAAPAAGGRR